MTTSPIRPNAVRSSTRYTFAAQPHWRYEALRISGSRRLQSVSPRNPADGTLQHSARVECRLIDYSNFALTPDGVDLNLSRPNASEVQHLPLSALNST